MHDVQMAAMTLNWNLKITHNFTEESNSVKRNKKCLVLRKSLLWSRRKLSISRQQTVMFVPSAGKMLPMSSPIQDQLDGFGLLLQPLSLVATSSPLLVRLCQLLLLFSTIVLRLQSLMHHTFLSIVFFFLIPKNMS